MTELTMAMHAIPHPEWYVSLAVVIALITIAAIAGIFLLEGIKAMIADYSICGIGNFAAESMTIIASLIIVLCICGSVTIFKFLEGNMTVVKEAFAEVGYDINTGNLPFDLNGGTEQVLKMPVPTIDGTTTTEPGSLFYRIDDDGVIHIYSNEVQVEGSQDMPEDQHSSTNQDERKADHE